MNFFQAQDQARRKTWQLGLMFAAAVVTLIVLTNVLFASVIGWSGSQTGLTFEQSIADVPWDAWLFITVGVVGVVGVASGYKYLTLRGGGRTIAESLGGNLLHQSTRDPKERRLLNVVEEMAIASGVAVPPVYLIPESSINAFAAGFNSDDAVIGINQGTIDYLDRSELQGVIAHEFSHILNGDTTINLRLIAILHGILFIGMIGYGLMRAGGYSRRDGAPLLALGVGLLVIGYGGTFFGNLIKSAVSRQREYLADASAVQFTREPGGIANALKKIGGLSQGSTMTNPRADEASHMFFGAAARKFAGNLMATHPPLSKRIRAIEPNWDGQFPAVAGFPSGAASSSIPGRAGFAEAGVTVQASPEEIVTQIGTSSAAGLQAARELIDSVDDPLSRAAHDPYEARALVYAMLFSAQPEVRRDQLAYVREHAEGRVPDHVERLWHALAATDKTQRLTLLEMAMPALKELSTPQYRRFAQNAAQLITADQTVELFEWVLHRLLIKELQPHFDGPQRNHGRINSLSKVSREAAKLLSILASTGHSDLRAQMAAYDGGAGELGLREAFSKQEAFDYERLNNALGKLRELRPLKKPALIKACAITVLADGHVTADEGALLRGIAAALDCPMPPSIYGLKGQPI